MSTKKRTVMLIDMQSFYASVEKVKYPQYKDKPLIVAGDPARRSGIVLAACPIAKKHGITTAMRLWEALQVCPDVVVIKPAMQDYIDTSMTITRILEDYTDLVEPYSIDELFADFTHSMHLFAETPEQMARIVQQRIKHSTGIHARAGIAENKILAKLCCDMIAKKNESGIFYLHKNELEKHIWHKPVEDMWGIGSKMKRHLFKMGIHTIGDLAKSPLPRLMKKWGVNGQIIWQCANGIDNSPVTTNAHDDQKVIGNGMTLPKDYREAWEIEVVLQELTIQICRRAREKGYMGQVVSVSCSGADWDYPTGFNRQKRLLDPSNISTEIFKTVKDIFHSNWDKQPVRRLGVAISQLNSDKVVQLDLFNVDREKDRKIDKVMDSLKSRFGETSIMRASSMTSAGQAQDRAAKIGGHYK